MHKTYCLDFDVSLSTLAKIVQSLAILRSQHMNSQNGRAVEGARLKVKIFCHSNNNNLVISSAQVSTIRFSNARYKSKMCSECSGL